MLTLASKHQQNGKQPLTETSTTESTPWRKRHRTPKKKIEREAQLKTNELHRTGLTASVPVYSKWPFTL